MKKFFTRGNKDTQEPPPPPPSDAPPSYEQSQGTHYTQKIDLNHDQIPQYSSGKYGPEECPPEKVEGGEFTSAGQDQTWHNKSYAGNAANFESAQPPPGAYTVPSNAFSVPPQKTNIAYETDERNTRPGYANYVQKDNERVAKGDFPKPREAFGNGGAPLTPSKKGKGTSRGFPGASGQSGPTFYNTSKD